MLGGLVKRLAEFALLNVPWRDTQPVQEIHITLGPISFDLVERHLFPLR